MFLLKSNSRIFAHSIRIILYLSAIITLCFSPNLYAQDCDDALENALESFGQQNYNQIIELLTDCPPEGFPDKARKIMAYELLVQAYFFTSQVDSVKGTLSRFLALQPDYSFQPPQYTEEFIKIVGEVKKERTKQESRSIFSNKWFYIGGSTVVAAVITAAMMFDKGGSDGKAKRLPDPPAFPGNN